MAARVRADRLAGLDLLVPSEHRLAEPDPTAGVGLVRRHVVTLGAHAHGQDVVGEPRCLGPRRRERDVAVDLLRVLQRLEPGEAVGVGPDRVVDPRKVCVELAAAFVEEVREQDRHLVIAQRELLRPAQLVPAREWRCTLGLVRSELVPAVAGCAALGADRAGEHVEEERGSGRLASHPRCRHRQHASCGWRTWSGACR